MLLGLFVVRINFRGYLLTKKGLINNILGIMEPYSRNYSRLINRLGV